MMDAIKKAAEAAFPDSEFSAPAVTAAFREAFEMGARRGIAEARDAVAGIPCWGQGNHGDFDLWPGTGPDHECNAPHARPVVLAAIDELTAETQPLPAPARRRTKETL